MILLNIPGQNGQNSIAEKNKIGRLYNHSDYKAQTYIILIGRMHKIY